MSEPAYLEVVITAGGVREVVIPEKSDPVSGVALYLKVLPLLGLLHESMLGRSGSMEDGQGKREVR